LSSLARKLCNKFGITLRNEVVEFALEKQTKNVFFYLRESDINTFDTTVKAIGCAIELFGSAKRLRVIEDLIEFYRSEWAHIDKLTEQAMEDEDNGK
jgi:hypothetical protein